MIEYMLANVICHEFEKAVGKHQYESRKAMHVGFHLSVGGSTDQYQVVHMYIYGPANYVHVAVQKERIDRNGKRHVEPMELLCYHDSCWRDSVQDFIFKNRSELNGFQSLLKLLDWYDVVTLTEGEREYLRQLVVRRDAWNDEGKMRAAEEKLRVNPFDERSVWRKK